MSTRTVVRLVDDLDGSEATETVQFALDGVRYEIDLSADNAARMRAELGRWLTVSRRVGGRRVRGTSGAGVLVPAQGTAHGAAGGDGEVSGAERAAIRTWARENGFEVSARGRLAASLVSAYRQAH